MNFSGKSIVFIKTCIWLVRFNLFDFSYSDSIVKGLTIMYYPKRNSEYCTLMKVGHFYYIWSCLLHSDSIQKPKRIRGPYQTSKECIRKRL